MSATADAAKRGGSVTAELNFIEPGGASPVYIASQAGDRDGALRTAKYKQYDVDIHDARPLAGQLTLDRNGFELIDHGSAVTDFFDEAQRKEIWEPEVIALIEQHADAESVFVFDHTLRADSPDMREAKNVREPASVVHND